MASVLPSSAPPTTPWRARHADADYGVSAEPNWRQVDWPAHLHQMEIGGRRVNYVDIGEGEPVVFIHGLAGQWQNFLENIPRAAQERRVLALDLPGHGMSEMPAEKITISAYARCVNEFCDKLGVERADFVGNSMGGFIACEVALQNPGRIDRLILISAAGITTSNSAEMPTRMVGRVAATITAYTAARQRGMARRPVGRHMTLALVCRHPSRIAADLAWEGLLKGAGKPGFRDALLASVQYDYRDRLSEIGSPTLIIWGENDSVITVRDAHEYERLISDSRKVVMEDTGHVPQVERPTATNDVIMEFLAETGPAEAKEPVDSVSERR